MAILSINVDHIASIREARGIDEPDPVLAAGIAELAGAEGIICHLRKDQRHIKARDLNILKQTVKTKLNLEMAPSEDMLKTALSVKPDMATIVPERPEELTTEIGLDVVEDLEKYKRITGMLKDAGISVSFFIDPDPVQIKEASRAGADIVELHTGYYSEAKTDADIVRLFEKIKDAANLAHELKLKAHAGHGLNYINIKRFSSIPAIKEYSIGHSIIARAVIVGLDQAIREMVKLVAPL